MESRSNIAVLGKIKFLINACDEIFFLRDLIDLHNFYLKLILWSSKKPNLT